MVTKKKTSKALQAAHAARAAMAAAGEKIERLNPTERAAKNPRSLRLAVTAKCFECVGSGQDRGWRDCVRECTVTRCSLWRVRPGARTAIAAQGA